MRRLEFLLALSGLVSTPPIHAASAFHLLSSKWYGTLLSSVRYGAVLDHCWRERTSVTWTSVAWGDVARGSMSSYFLLIEKVMFWLASEQTQRNEISRKMVNVKPCLHDATFVEHWWIFVETCWPTEIAPCERPFNIDENCSPMLWNVQECSHMLLFIHGCSRTSVLFNKSRIV